MICPSCLSGGLSTGYVVAFAICALFFIVAFVALLWASRSGRLDNLEETKFSMLKDEE